MEVLWWIKQKLIMMTSLTIYVMTSQLPVCLMFHCAVLFTFIFSERERERAVARPSVCRLSVCLSSVTLMYPIHLFRQLKLSAIFIRVFGTLPFVDMHGKFYGDCPMRTPPSREGEGRRGLYARVVAKYSDFWPIEGYISETVQDRR